MGGLVDATGLLLVNLSLFVYTIRRHGVELSTPPVRVDPLDIRASLSEWGWEIWCEHIEMKPRRSV